MSTWGPVAAGHPGRRSPRGPGRADCRVSPGDQRVTVTTAAVFGQSSGLSGFEVQPEMDSSNVSLSSSLGSAKFSGVKAAPLGR